MTPPRKPKIYHIVHVDRLPSIIADGYLWCDREAIRRGVLGTAIGIGDIKDRRLNELTLTSHPDLQVGACVPFYFCTRSVMLYVISKANHTNLAYRGGQGPIVHLESDLHDVVAWANANKRRWAFTTSNAGSYYFKDYSNLACLNQVNWKAIQATQWQGIQEDKQAEFLIEDSFPWELVERIGVLSAKIQNRVYTALQNTSHWPRVAIIPDWYY